MAHEWDHKLIKDAIDDREIELKRDITYGEIAKYCDVKWGTIERVVNGRANPSVNLMAKIAKFVNKPLEHFEIKGGGNPEPELSPLPAQ